jgi:tetratricopeptide (TPR) repeat protein
MSELTDQANLLRQVRLALQNEDFKTAIQGLKQAATAAHDSGDIPTEGRHLGNLALIYYRIQKPDRALECFEQALAIARAESDRLTEDGILGNMGNILREVGRHTEALDYLSRALLIAQEIGDVRGRGIWLSNLGLVHDDLNQRKEAIEVHKESVSVARIMRDQRGLVTRLSNLGNSYLAMNDTSEALKCFHEVVALYKALGDKQAAALRMGIIGNIYSDLGRAAPSEFEARFYFDLARDAYRDTLVMAQEIGDQVAEGDLLISLGNVFGNMGDLEQAIQHFIAAYQHFEVLGQSDRLPYIRQNIELAQSLKSQKQG